MLGAIGGDIVGSIYEWNNIRQRIFRCLNFDEFNKNELRIYEFFIANPNATRADLLEALKFHLVQSTGQSSL